MCNKRLLNSTRMMYFTFPEIGKSCQNWQPFQEKWQFARSVQELISWCSFNFCPLTQLDILICKRFWVLIFYCFDFWNNGTHVNILSFTEPTTISLQIENLKSTYPESILTTTRTTTTTTTTTTTKELFNLFSPEMILIVIPVIE